MQPTLVVFHNLLEFSQINKIIKKFNSCSVKTLKGVQIWGLQFTYEIIFGSLGEDIYLFYKIQENAMSTNIFGKLSVEKHVLVINNQFSSPNSLNLAIL